MHGEQGAGKYSALWKYIQACGKPQLTLKFEKKGEIAGVPLDNSFLKYKKELHAYGYAVKKIL